MRDLKAFLLFLVLWPSIVTASDEPIGFVAVPIPEKIIVDRKGSPKIFIGKDSDTHIGYDEEKSYTRLIKFDIYSEPSSEGKKLLSVSTAGLMGELVTLSTPGVHRFKSFSERDDYLQGQHQIIVYEKKSEWVRVKFLDQPPWNGRSGWFKLSNRTGGFVAVEEP